jgi:hypothetical protein
MLRARVSARLASAAWRAGQRQQALDHYAAALRQDPTILRRLDLPLPITPGGANNDTGAELVSYLNRSPRFTLVEQGLPLEILTTDTPSLCLRDSAGDALSCVELQANDRLADGVAVVDTDDSNAQRLARQFHDRTFSLAYTIDRSQRVALLGNSVIFSNQNASQQQRQDAVLQR